MFRVPMKWTDPEWNIKCEGSNLGSVLMHLTDAEIRSYGDQNRLDTCVVHKVNDANVVLTWTSV